LKLNHKCEFKSAAYTQTATLVPLQYKIEQWECLIDNGQMVWKSVKTYEFNESAISCQHLSLVFAP